MSPVLSSGPLDVEVDPERATVSFPGSGPVPLGPLEFLTTGRWPPGPLPPPSDEDPDSTAGDWRPLGPFEDVTSDGQACRVDAVAGPRDGATGSATVAIESPDEGVVTVTIAVSGAAVCRQRFAAQPGERFVGFGERSHTVGLGRGVIEHYVAEGPYQQYEYPFLVGIVPPWALRNRPDATYFPIPWTLSTRGYGVLLERDEVSYSRVRTDAEGADGWAIEVESGTLAYSVFAGPSPLEALERFTRHCGRQPAPERWWFGPWYQSGHDNHVPLEEEIRQADVVLGAGAAVSAVETHCRYLPVGEDRGYEADERARTALFHGRGLAVVSYLNPLLSEDYPEAFVPADAAGVLQGRPEGGTYVFPAYAGGREPPVTMETQYDFTNPAADDAWSAVAARLVDAGYDGWMEDFGEDTPLDAVAADGSTGTGLHNAYARQFHEAADRVAARHETRVGRRLARFVRSGWTGSAAASPIVWGGDPTTSWGFDGLASAVINGLSMGASGVAMWGSDIGGFFSTLDHLTPELLIRWIQFGAFCPVMRTKSQGIEVPAYRRPQIWDDAILPHWVRWSRFHTRLNDYLLGAHETYRRTGRPIMCALELAHPGLGVADDQYLFGPDLLVAPVLEPGATSREVLVPPGDWVGLFDAAVELHGPGRQTVAVTLDEIPVFLRAGAVLPLLPDDGRSLSPYA